MPDEHSTYGVCILEVAGALLVNTVMDFARLVSESYETPSRIFYYGSITANLLTAVAMVHAIGALLMRLRCTNTGLMWINLESAHPAEAHRVATPVIGTLVDAARATDPVSVAVTAD